MFGLCCCVIDVRCSLLGVGCLLSVACCELLLVIWYLPFWCASCVTLSCRLRDLFLHVIVAV